MSYIQFLNLDNMKILIDGRLLSTKPTGISRVTLELIKSYETYYGKENVNVICNSSKFSNEFNVIITNLKPFNIFHFLKFYFFLKSLNPYIYHSPFYSGSLLKIKKTIIILNVNDLMFYKIKGFFSTNKLINFTAKVYYMLLVWLSLRSSNFILSISKTTRKDLMKIFRLDSMVINLGIINNNHSNTEVFEDNFLKKNNLVKNSYFLYVGNNRPHKNINFLIEAYKASNTSLKLLLVGFKDDGLINQHNIINIASVLDKELEVLYDNCKAFVFPSLYEGFGLPIIEAISRGCIVLSSNAGSLAEFEFKSVKYFNPQNLEQLVTLIENIGSFSFYKEDIQLLSKYDWKIIFEGYQTYLQEYLVKNSLKFY